MLTDSQMQDKGYNLNDDEVGDLLLTIKGADQITEAYSTAWFRVMMRAVDQIGFGNEKDGMVALETVDKRLYPLVKAKVLDGVTDPIERNRKTAFHRVAKHLVKKAIIMSCDGTRAWDVHPTIQKNDIVKAWKGRTRPSIDPVSELMRDWTKLKDRADRLGGQGLYTTDFWTRVRDDVL